MSVKSHRFSKKIPGDANRVVEIGSSWKDVIFLPFNKLFMGAFMAVTYMSVMYNIYMFAYHPPKFPMLVSFTFDVVCEIIYLAMAVLILLHMLMKVHSQRRIFKPSPLFLIVVDLISILPLRNLYIIVNSYTWEDQFSEHHLKYDNCYLKFIRIVRLVFFYFNLRKDLTNNQRAVLILSHILASFLFISIIAAVYYNAGLRAIENESATWMDRWTQYQNTTTVDKCFTWFIICVTEIAGPYYNNSLRAIKYTNMNDIILVFTAMLLGFIAQYTFLLGTQTSEELQAMRAKYNLQLRLNAAKNLMTALIMPEHFQTTIRIYYETIWNYRFGEVTTPDFVNKLPPFMQSEILTDMYWEALLHTKIFNNVSNVFRRVIAEQMKTEIYMKGHHVFRDKDIKAKLVYLQSGVLEIHSSREDSKITLTSGSVLCEVSCMQMSKSTASVKCLTNCTIHVLYMVDFYSALMQKYTPEFRVIRSTYQDRINYCRRKTAAVAKRGTARMSHMRWVKTQWRSVFDRNWPTHDAQFTSKYLDLIATVEKVTHPNAFCLSGKCPFVMISDTPLMFMFHYLTLLTSALHFFMTFKEIFFEFHIVLGHYKYYVLMDTVFFVDIYVQCITTIKTPEQVIQIPYEILIYKLKTVSFMVDVAATAPLDYLGLLAAVPLYVVGMLRINRYLRLYKIIIFFHYHEKRVTSYAGVLKFFKFAVYHIILGLLFTSFVFACNCSDGGCVPNGFLQLVKDEHVAQVGSNATVSNFLICNYYTLNVYMRLILRVYEQTYLPDVGMRMLIVVTSYYMLSIEFAETCALVGLRYENHELLQEYVEMIHIHVKEHRQLKQYKGKLLECLLAEWSVSGDLRFDDLSRVTHQNSEFLRRNVNDEYVLWIMRQADFFKVFPERMLLFLAHRSNIYLVPEGHDIVKFGTRSFYLYIIAHGFCREKSYIAGDWEKEKTAIYKRLDVFPILEFLHQLESMLDVRSDTAVQVIAISYSVFQDCLTVYAAQNQILQESLRQHMARHWGILRQISFQPNAFRFSDAIDLRKKTAIFEYKARQQKLILDITNCSQQQERNSLFLKYRRTLKLITTYTYNPTSRFYVAYEIFRCVCILIHVTMTYLLCLAPVYNNAWTHVTLYALIILWFVDVLIQCHVAYYNEDGILVTALRATTKHYLRHSFALGFVGGLPYQLFGFEYFARPERQAAIGLIIIINMRAFLLLRPFRLANYLRGNGRTKTQKFLWYVAMVFMVYHYIMHITTMKLLLTCDIGPDRKYTCPKLSWIMLRTTFTEWDESKFFWITLRSVATSGVTVADNVSLAFDHVLAVVIGILMFLMRIALLGLITGNNCISQARLVEHQCALKRYNDFFRDRMVSNSTKRHFLDHYKNIWQKSYSDKAEKIFENIYPHLREKLLLTMYHTAISKCILFKDENVVLFKICIPYFEVRYYAKNAHVFRTNDVQGNIFIVVKGQVEMSMAGTRLSSLRRGSIFGCFEPVGLTRHTMAAQAILHTNVLTIKANLFFQLIKGYPKVEAMMRQLRFLQFQYATLHVQSKYGRESDRSSISRKTDLGREKYLKLYKLYTYVTDVHIAPLSAYLVLIHAQVEFGVMNFLPVWLLLDLYFGLCFVVRPRMPIYDSKTGFLIVSRRDLYKKYLTSFLFVIDFASVLPIYLIRIWMHKDEHQLVFLANKLLRIYCLYYQYRGYVRTKVIPRHIQWTLMVYTLLFLSQLIYIIWWFIQDLPYEEKIYTKFLFLGYIYMMNYVSASGLLIDADYQPSYVIQMSIDMVLVIMSTGLVITLATLFTKSVISGNSYECIYRYKARLCKQFCRVTSVSSSLVLRTWTYLHVLYQKQGGEQFPNLYDTAPKYLKQEHMQSLYGKHFTDHPLFYDLHVDLLKQMQTYIKCHYYIPGSIIVERGSKKGDFYFIEAGSVLALQSNAEDDDNIDNVYEVLAEGHSFGEVQAFLNLEYNKTYKALTSVDLISIAVSDWEHLLEWFPASKQKLNARVNEHVAILRKYYIQQQQKKK